jgi:hypothetical protein
VTAARRPSITLDETVVDATGAAGLDLLDGGLYGACGTCFGTRLSDDRTRDRAARAETPVPSPWT